MSPANLKILVIEDEPSQVELLSYNLKSQGYSVITANDGERGVERARQEAPDLVLLDWMLPLLSGIEVCRQLRRMEQTRQIPIIMLTARSEENDRVRGLDVGADDYLGKPYSIRELLARVRAALRRPTALGKENVLESGRLSVDLSSRKVSLAGNNVHLGPTEFRLLVTLMRAPDRVFSRDRLLDLVWGMSADINTRTVDVHVGRLRRALENDDRRQFIRTVRGGGYAFHRV